MQNKLYKTILTLLVVILVLYVAEVKLYLSWVYWWYDMVLHFLGGFVAGLLVLAFLQYFFDIFIEKPFKIFVAVLLGTFVIGVVWEIYELYFELVSLVNYEEYLFDTKSDLVLDVTGSIFSFLYFYRIWRKA